MIKVSGSRWHSRISAMAGAVQHEASTRKSARDRKGCFCMFKSFLRFPYPFYRGMESLRQWGAFLLIVSICVTVALFLSNSYPASMTRLAILSDPHANLAALTAVFRDIDIQGYDAIVCLGDLVGYGPQPQECCDLIRERDVTLIQGNHEQGLINIYHLHQFNQPARDALRKTREMITDETYEWLVSHAKSAVLHGCRFVHGTPPDSTTEYIWKYEHRMDEMFRRFSEAVCFVGHTHDLMRFTYSSNGTASGKLALMEGETVLDPSLRHLVNPGAVGQPRDGNNKAKYALYDTDSHMLTMRFVSYDIQKTADLIVERGFHRGFADRLW